MRKRTSGYRWHIDKIRLPTRAADLPSRSISILGGDLPDVDLGSIGASRVSIEDNNLSLAKDSKSSYSRTTGTNGCSSTRSWTGSVRNAMVAGSYASIGRRSAAYRSPAGSRITHHP
jgi:hypothetical protein